MDHKEMDTTKQAHACGPKAGNSSATLYHLQYAVFSELDQTQQCDLYYVATFILHVMDVLSPSPTKEPGARSHTLCTLLVAKCRAQAQIRNCVFTN